MRLRLYSLLPFLLCCFAAQPMHAQQRDSFAVFFRLNVPGLDAPAKSKLDRLVYNGLLHDRQQLQIVGYADYVGSNGYNDTLSMQRATAVRNYLVDELQLPAANISLYTGRGEVARPGLSSADGYALDRRVDIFINRPRPVMPPVAVNPPVGRQNAPPVRIDQLQENETLQLNNLFFFTQTHRFKDSSYIALAELLRTMKENPTLEISIEGHICCYRGGTDAYDLDSKDYNLSLHRAEAVYQYLIDNGIAAARMRTAGFGRSRPAVPIERTEEDAQKNRRVEIRVIRR